jgi:hypothetical protein
MRMFPSWALFVKYHQMSVAICDSSEKWKGAGDLPYQNFPGQDLELDVGSARHPPNPVAAWARPLYNVAHVDHCIEELVGEIANGLRVLWEVRAVVDAVRFASPIIHALQLVVKHLSVGDVDDRWIVAVVDVVLKLKEL